MFKPDSRPGPKSQRAKEAAAAAAYAEATRQRDVPHTGGGGARGGLAGSYYYGAVGAAGRTLPVEEPKRCRWLYSCR